MFKLHYHQPPFEPELVGEFISLDGFMRLINTESDTLLDESATGPDDVEALKAWALCIMGEWPIIQTNRFNYTYPGEKNMVGSWILTEEI